MIVCTRCQKGYLQAVKTVGVSTERTAEGFKESYMKSKFDQCTVCFATFNEHTIKVEKDK